MDLSRYTVQVTRPSVEHSLSQGVVGVAKRLGINFQDVYSLDAADPEDRDKVQGMLFHESELERLL